MATETAKRKRSPKKPKEKSGVLTKQKFVPPPPPPPTDEELEAVGLVLDATPQHNANCPASASSQSKSNHSFNEEMAEGYQNAMESYAVQPQGREQPPPPCMPSLDGVFDPHRAYYRLEDAHALEVFCRNDRPVPYDTKNWNWNATKF